MCNRQKHFKQILLTINPSSFFCKSNNSSQIQIENPRMTSVCYWLEFLGKMAGVLFVIYIPCDDSSDDTPGTEGKSEGKRESKRPGASQADDEKDAEEDSEWIVSSGGKWQRNSFRSDIPGTSGDIIP